MRQDGNSTGTTPEEGDEPITETPSDSTLAPDDDDSKTTLGEPSDDEPIEDEGWTKLTEKHGGDQRKIAADYWQSKNYASKTNKENQELRAKLEALEKERATPKAEPKEPDAEAHPDLQVYDNQLNELGAQFQELSKHKVALVQQHTKILGRIAVLEDRLENLDEFEDKAKRSQLKERLSEAKEKKADLESAHQSDELIERRIRLQAQQLIAARQKAQAHLESNRAEDEQAKEWADEDAARQREDFQELMGQLMQEHKIPKDMKKQFEKYVKGTALIDLPDDQFVSDREFETRCRAVAKEFADQFDVAQRAGAKQVSKEVAKNISVKTPAPKAKPSEPDEELYSDPFTHGRGLTRGMKEARDRLTKNVP